ncbi:MAG: FG-GAP-like repeat-containing protein, partial [Actinomycetota bacterium]
MVRSSGAGTLGLGLHHVVFTRDASGVTRTYIDGVVAVEQTVSGDFSNWDPSTPFVLGNEADGARPWLGTYRLVAVYDRALTPVDVCTNRGAGPPSGLDDADVSDVAPFVCLTVPAEATVGRDVVLDASLTRDLDGEIVELAWDFGDGTQQSGTDDVVTHRFAATGDYVVTVTATDDDGLTETATERLVVRPDVAGRLAWTRIESPDPRLADPRSAPPGYQQTASLVGDLDGDGDDDFIIAGRREPGASIVWYENDGPGSAWSAHTLEPTIFPIDAGGAVHDIDGDGDLDVAFGGDGSSSDMWWWENPGPAGATGTWSRHVIKQDGGRQHHDFVFADVDDDGAAELVYWNQKPRPGGDKLFLAEIPADPTSAPWPAELIFQGATPSEGLVVDDIDLDGDLDLVGGGHWFERQPDGAFTPHAIDADYTFSRVATGQLVDGGRPEIVISSGDAIGPLHWYEWDEPTGTWTPHVLEDVQQYAHSLDIADLDGDGHLDIFTAEMMSPFDYSNPENPGAEMLVHFGDGQGGFVRNTVDVGFDNHESRLGDIDGDGDLDIVGKPFNVGSPGVNLWLNEGIDPFARWSRSEIDGNRPWNALFVEHADLDGDGHDDVITGGWW